MMGLVGSTHPNGARHPDHGPLAFVGMRMIDHRPSRTVVARLVVAASLVAVIPFMSAGVAGAVASQSFATCAEAAAAGFTDISQGSPGYAAALDRDGDGIACEADDTAAATTTTTPAEVLGATQTAQPPPGQLASTGTSSWVLTMVALVLVLVGHRMVRAGYDRLEWIVGRRHADVRFTVEPDRRRRRR